MKNIYDSDPEILALLLQNRITKKNILLACDSHVKCGGQYRAECSKAENAKIRFLFDCLQVIKKMMIYSLGCLIFSENLPNRIRGTISRILRPFTVPSGADLREKSFSFFREGSLADLRCTLFTQQKSGSILIHPRLLPVSIYWAFSRWYTFCYRFAKNDSVCKDHIFYSSFSFN